MTNTNNQQEAKKLQIRKVEEAVSIKHASHNKGIVFLYKDPLRGNKESAIFYETLPTGRDLLAEVCVNCAGKYQAHVILDVGKGKPLFKMMLMRDTFHEFFDWMCGAIMQVRRLQGSYFKE